MEIKRGMSVIDQHGVEWLVLTDIGENGEFEVVNESGRRTATLRLVPEERAS